MRKTTIITDPIHQVMNLGSDPSLRKCLMALIDTKTFQRLRRISQLGLASYVFPGATHTRFSHSLGAAYLAHSVLVHLKEWSEDSDREEIEEHFKEVIIAALLHDVGHGPFSHSFEQVLNKYHWAPSHEDWTATLISNPQSEIQQRLRAYGIAPSTIASVFVKSGGSDLPRPYRQIVSSQLDVDRMDYLIRDSHFAGVAIGRFDAHYLINSVVIVSHGNSGSEKTLGLTPKGVKAYEAFLLARQLMNRTVYYHHNVKVLEFMIEHILRLTVQHVFKLIANKRIGPFIPQYFRRVGEAIQSGRVNKQEFMKKSHDDYVRLTEDVTWTLVSALANSTTVPAAQILAQKLLTRDILPHFMIKTGRKELLQECLIEAGFDADTDFHLVDLKTTMYRANSNEHVFVLGWDRSIEEIAEHSDTISAFQDRPEAESLLIIVDAMKQKKIERLAREHRFVVPR
jgi:uncharacterized protein